MTETLPKIHSWHLPRPRTRFIGRQAERDTARTLLLDEGVPLLSLTGPGGVGKTRLALEIAAEAMEEFADGVVFVDIGNVYPTISDFSLTDLRESAGVGIRLRTPWVLLRSDYGFVLDPRPGERRSRFYFSIGQAF